MNMVCYHIYCVECVDGNVDMGASFLTYDLFVRPSSFIIGAILVMKQVLKTESQLEKSIRIIATLESMRSSVMSMGEAMESLESYQQKLDTVVSSPAPAVQYTKPRDILKLAQLRHKLCQKEARSKEVQQPTQRSREVEEEKEEIEPPKYHDESEDEDDRAATFKLPALHRHETEDYHTEHLEV